MWRFVWRGVYIDSPHYTSRRPEDEENWTYGVQARLIDSHPILRCEQKRTSFKLPLLNSFGTFLLCTTGRSSHKWTSWATLHDGSFSLLKKEGFRVQRTWFLWCDFALKPVSKEGQGIGPTRTLKITIDPMQFFISRPLQNLSPPKLGLLQVCLRPRVQSN